jgi:hypothetical protein
MFFPKEPRIWLRKKNLLRRRPKPRSQRSLQRPSQPPRRSRITELEALWKTGWINSSLFFFFGLVCLALDSRLRGNDKPESKGLNNTSEAKTSQRQRPLGSSAGFFFRSVPLDECLRFHDRELFGERVAGVHDGTVPAHFRLNDA